MGRFICLHVVDTNNKSKPIWIRADSIVVIRDMRHTRGYTEVVVDTGEGLLYSVQETVESVIGLIKQQTNPLDNYVCPTPETVKNLKNIKSKE